MVSESFSSNRVLRRRVGFSRVILRSPGSLDLGLALRGAGGYLGSYDVGLADMSYCNSHVHTVVANCVCVCESFQASLVC